jgi:hypothetical protein
MQNSQTPSTATVNLTQDECCAILVGMSEFEAIVHKKNKTYGAFDKTTKEVIEKFRKICFDVVRNNN